MASVAPADVPCVFQPQELLGLDYYLRVYNKMYIGDVCRLRLYPLINEVFAYKNHPIFKVDILGVVVRVEQRAKCFIYALDDGTGVVSCCCWKQDNRDNQFVSLPESLQQKLNDIQEDEDTSVQGYCHGDLVHVKGKVKVFREVNEVTAIYHAKMDKPMAEVMRMMELPKLYKACYDKFFELPFKVKQEVDIAREEHTTGVKSLTRIFKEVCTAVSDHLKSSPSLSEFFVSQMCRLPRIVAIVTQQHQGQDECQSSISVVTQALQTLEEHHGTVCRRMEARGLYESLHHKSALDRTILKILVSETQKFKYAEKGCHYMHILDELHKTVQYSKLHKTALIHCLQKLETQSDVIRAYHNQYLPCVI